MDNEAKEGEDIYINLGNSCEWLGYLHKAFSSTFHKEDFVLREQAMLLMFF